MGADLEKQLYTHSILFHICLSLSFTFILFVYIFVSIISSCQEGQTQVGRDDTMSKKKSTYSQHKNELIFLTAIITCRV